MTYRQHCGGLTSFGRPPLCRVRRRVPRAEPARSRGNRATSASAAMSPLGMCRADGEPTAQPSGSASSGVTATRRAKVQAESRCATCCPTGGGRVPQRPLPPGRPGPRALRHRAGGDEMPVPGHPVTGPERYRSNPVGPTVVESARGAVSALLPIRFLGPLAEPGVRVSTRRALHGRSRQAWFVRR